MYSGNGSMKLFADKCAGMPALEGVPRWRVNLILLWSYVRITTLVIGGNFVQGVDIHVFAHRDEEAGDQGRFRLDLHARRFGDGHAGKVREDGVDAVGERNVAL